MATIHVDGKAYPVNGAHNLLQACLSLGLDIPYFCWHPALGSVGACRQCAVKQYANADDKTGRIVMSCMTPAQDNTLISINDEEARAFRQNVIEWLMAHHPHDCPVCEEGGHCHLQDMTVMVGHHARRYRFSKRTHNNQALGPFINHEMNRCIACYRCVRYYKDYADGTDLGVFGAHDNLYFGRVADGTLESEFSGNLVEVCPTGVFTDKTHSERYNRKWDMMYAPSICQQCGIGCNISPGERYGELRRIENRFHGEINRYFLCDRGRFGYGYINRQDRPRQPLVKEPGGWRTLDGEAVLGTVVGILRGRRLMGIGSPRASLEANLALKQLVGAENFSVGIATDELRRIRLILDVMMNGSVRTPSLHEIESFDAVLVLGEDVTQTAPRVALALRQTVKNQVLKVAASRKVMAWQAEVNTTLALYEQGSLFVATAMATRLDDIATATFWAAPEDIARLGFAVAHAIDAQAPAVDSLDVPMADLSQRIAKALLAAAKPLVVSGTGAGSDAVIQAAANIGLALTRQGRPAGLSLMVPEVNSLGVALLEGQPVEEALHRLTTHPADTVAVILENDLFRRADAEQVQSALNGAISVVVIDHQMTATAKAADVLLSSASFAEGDGTVVNSEGRAQRFFRVYDPSYYDPTQVITESWRWLHRLEGRLHDHEETWLCLDDAVRACAAESALARILEAAPESGFRIQGLQIARAPFRYSGRTALRADRSVHEPRAPQDPDSPLAFSMEGYSGQNTPAALLPFVSAPGWNSPQAWNKFQDEVGGHSRGGDAGIRLIEPSGKADYFSHIPSRFVAREKRGCLVPLYHLFGSEELSSRSPLIETCMTGGYVMIPAADAMRLDIQEGDEVEIRLGDDILLCLPARLSPSLAQGLLGLPAGFPGIPPFSVRRWAVLRKRG
ncbi:MAG: NADH-quinone oxidoreductase subunit NuoG [Pseudomonadota bacterium]